MMNRIPEDFFLDSLLEGLTNYAKVGQSRTDLSDYRQDGDEVFLYLLDTKFYLSHDTESNLKDEWDQLDSTDIPNEFLEYETAESKEFLRYKQKSSHLSRINLTQLSSFRSLRQLFQIRKEILRTCANCNQHLRRELTTDLCLTVYIPDEYQGKSTIKFVDLLHPNVHCALFGTAICNNIVVDDEEEQDADNENRRVSCSKLKTIKNTESFIGDSDLLAFRLGCAYSISTVVEFPEILPIAEYGELFPDVLEDSEFELKAVLCFVRKIQNRRAVNHWVTYRRFAGNNTWYLYDDSKVIPVANNAHIYKDPKIVLYERRSLDEDRLDFLN